MKNIFTMSRFFLTLLIIVLMISCKKENSLQPPASDKEAVFKELWKVIDERYALFDEKQVDWNDVFRQYGERVNGSLTDDQFFQLMSDMLSLLKDGHVSLKSASRQYNYEGFYSGFVKNFSYAVLINNYLKNDYSKAGPVVYKIVNNVGYIYFNSFASPLSTSDIDIVMSNMKDVKGLIIDVRNNLGGNTLMADHLFANFIQQQTLAKFEKIKKGKAHGDFYNARPFYIQPAPMYFGKQVIVLTNRSCYSACNDFVLYMSLLDNVKIWGDQTGGGGSVPNNYLMANGWLLQYSATVTLSPNKVSIEAGIQPDELILMTPIQESAGYDPLLDNAYKALQ